MSAGPHTARRLDRNARKNNVISTGAQWSGEIPVFAFSRTPEFAPAEEEYRDLSTAALRAFGRDDVVEGVSR
jgi:hypothetical protein